MKRLAAAAAAWFAVFLALTFPIQLGLVNPSAWPAFAWGWTGGIIAWLAALRVWRRIGPRPPEFYAADILVARHPDGAIMAGVEGPDVLRPGESAVLSIVIAPDEVIRRAPDPGCPPVTIACAAEIEVTRRSWLYRHWVAGRAWAAGRHGPDLRFDADFRELPPR